MAGSYASRGRGGIHSSSLTRLAIVCGTTTPTRSPRSSSLTSNTENAINEPRLRDDLPIMLGGAGEEKTFALAARFAQHLNIICDPADLPRKLEALDQRCAETGRSRSTLETSFLGFVMIDENGDRAREQQRAFLRSRGIDMDALADEERAAVTARQFVGDPDQVAADLKARVLDPGVDGLVINLVTNGHQPGVVDLAHPAQAGRPSPVY